MPDIVFEGLDARYLDSSGRIRCDVVFRNLADDTAIVHFDSEIDLGDNGNINESYSSSMTVGDRGAYPSYFDVSESELPIDIRGCVEVTNVEVY